MWIDGLGLNQPIDRSRRLQTSFMGEVNGYRVGDMADAAVPVFKGPIVPVAGGLQCERHHQDGHHYGQDPVCSSARHAQLQPPH